MTEYLITVPGMPPGIHCGLSGCLPCDTATAAGHYVDRALSVNAVDVAVDDLLTVGAAEITVTKVTS